MWGNHPSEDESLELKNRRMMMDRPRRRKPPDEVRRNMSAIRSTGSKIEVSVRSALWRSGYRFRKNDKRLPGKPDIVFPTQKVAVFCDSDYWHGRNWDTLQRRLTTNREYWVAKIERNRQRDAEVNAELQELGWTVLRFWESEIKKDLSAVLDRITDQVDGGLRKSNHSLHNPTK